MKFLFIFISLFSFLNSYTQTNNLKYKHSDSIALNIQHNKYYYYEETTQELTENLKTEEEKCRAIFRWICDNIKYDYKTLNDYKRDRTDPTIVHKTKKAVCAGYASLFQAMCEEAKINCFYIIGYDTFNHAWNIA